MVSRAEHRRATLRRLGDAAVELFDTIGPGVTIDRIAERAGVSRRTVFRYVELKEELAYVHPILWFDIFDEVIAANAALSAADRLRVGGRALASHIDADPGPPYQAFLTAATNPELAKGFTSIFQRWVDRIADEVLVGIDAPSPDQRFRSRVVGAAVMGTIDAVSREWLLGGGADEFLALLERGFEILDPLLDGLDRLDG